MFVKLHFIRIIYILVILKASARDIWDKEKKSIKFHAFSSPELKVCLEKRGTKYFQKTNF